MTTDEIARLRGLAESLPYKAVTLGKDRVVAHHRDRREADVVSVDAWTRERKTALLTYIAAVDPPTLLRLLEERDRLAKELRSLNKLHRPWLAGEEQT